MPIVEQMLDEILGATTQALIAQGLTPDWKRVLRKVVIGVVGVTGAKVTQALMAADTCTLHLIDILRNGENARPKTVQVSG
jgi:hypothetical protein